MEHLREAAAQTNVAKVVLNLSPHAEMTPGIASYITELLFRNGVNILDAFLGYGDIIMVVDDKDPSPMTFYNERYKAPCQENELRIGASAGDR